MLILKPLSIDQSVAGANIPAVTSTAQAGIPAHELAQMLDSLARVSRRVEGNHLVIVGWEARITAGQWKLPRGGVELLVRTHLPTALRVYEDDDEMVPFDPS